VFGRPNSGLGPDTSPPWGDPLLKFVQLAGFAVSRPTRAQPT